MPAYLNVDGEACLSGVLIVPQFGPWYVEVVFVDAPDLEDGASVTVGVGALSLSGTVDPGHNGVFGEQRRARIVAGGGGWGTSLSSQHYHNDAGVRSLAVAQDAARLAGETLGTFNPANSSVGIAYTRQAGLASRVLEDVIGGVPWWVGYDGATIVDARAEVEAETGSYEVLDVSPGERLATLAIDDLREVGIGSILTDGLEAPLTVRELEVTIGVDESRTVVWGGGETDGRGRLAGLVRGLVESVVDDRLFGKYRYRVVAMDGNRVQLQRVALLAGLPDILPVAQKPGVSGAHAALAGGSVVLVEFVEGDRTMPLVVAYAGKDEEGHEPTELDFSVGTTMRLGSDGASEGVGLGDSLKSYLDAHTHGCPNTGTGSILTSPPSASPSGMPLDPAPSGSGKVKVDS